MKRTDPIRIDKLIEMAVEQSGNTDTFNRQHVCYLWPEVVGPTINRYTTARWMHNDELHVTIASGPIKNELAFMADAITEHLNRLAGARVVNRLIIH